MNHPDPVHEGVLLALTAEQLGLLDEHALTAVLAYYERQGRRGSLSPDEALLNLGGLSPEALSRVRSAPRVTLALGPRPFSERLQLLGTLGEGGMGTVYRAYDKLLRRVVALKVIRPERLGLKAQRALQRFEREAQVMARVRHPNCVAIHSAGRFREQPILIMEYVRGESLEARLEREGPQDPHTVARWGRDLAHGLAACHAVGVVHRDVKPANVILDTEGQPRLTDFGIALDADAHTKLTADSAAVGTLAYMPPEQALGRPADPRSDLYALGASLFELLCGQLVFNSEQALMLLHQIASHRARSVRSVRPDVPLDLARVVGKCLEKDPRDRYAAAAELAADLNAFLEGQPVGARPLGAIARGYRWTRRRRAPLLALLSLCLLGIIAASWANVWRKARVAEQDRKALEFAMSLPPRDQAAALTSLALVAEPEVALAAREALDPARHRAAIVEARVAIAALEAHFTRMQGAVKEKMRLEGAGVDQLPLMSAEKQRYLTLRAELRQARAEQTTLGLRARLALGRSESFAVASSSEYAQAWADLLALEASESQNLDQQNALRAEAAHRLKEAGLDVPPALGPPQVRLSVGGQPASATVCRFTLDPTVGRWVKGAGLAFDLGSTLTPPPGNYVAEIVWQSAPRRVQPVPFVATRGVHLDTKIQPPVTLDRRWAWNEFAYVPAGQVYGRADPHSFDFDNQRHVGEFYVARVETPLETWIAYRCWLGWPSTTEIPLGTSDASVNSLPRVELRRLPTVGVTVADITQFARFYDAEMVRARIPMRLMQPLSWHFSRALRGPFRWIFSWGSDFDPSFVSRDGLLSVGTSANDRSVFGVEDLVSSVSEIGASDSSAGIQVCFGGTATDSWATVEDKMLALNLGRLGDRSAYVGFRLYAVQHALPEVIRNPTLCQAHKNEGFRLLELNEYFGAIREGTAAIDADVLDIDAWLLRGAARLRIGDTWGGYFDGCRIVELDPESFDGWSLIGMVQHGRGFQEEALEASDRAAEIDPTIPETYFRRAKVKAALEDTAGALADLDEFERRAGPQHPMRKSAAALRAKLGG